MISRCISYQMAVQMLSDGEVLFEILSFVQIKLIILIQSSKTFNKRLRWSINNFLKQKSPVQVTKEKPLLI